MMDSVGIPACCENGNLSKFHIINYKRQTKPINGVFCVNIHVNTNPVTGDTQHGPTRNLWQTKICRKWNFIRDAKLIPALSRDGGDREVSPVQILICTDMVWRLTQDCSWDLGEAVITETYFSYSCRLRGGEEYQVSFDWTGSQPTHFIFWLSFLSWCLPAAWLSLSTGWCISRNHRVSGLLTCQPQ